MPSPSRTGSVNCPSIWKEFILAPLVGPLPAEAQKAVHRIGYIRSGSGPLTKSPAYMGFRKGLRALGYVEGQNVVFEDRYAGLTERPLGELAAQLAAELVALEVDVIVTSPSPSVIRAAQRATRRIPIVMPYTVVDPIEARFVQSLARPGGNITGLINLESELYAKRLGLLKEAFPRVSRVVVLWGMDPPKHRMQEVAAMGQSLGIEIRSVVLKARRLKSLKKVFATISRERPDGLLVSPSAFMRRHRARIIDFTAKRRIPTMYGRSYFVDSGGLMSYGANRIDLFRRAANYVDKILKGANPGDLPVGHPTTYNLVVNLKTAKALGTTMPSSIIYRADEVIR